MFIKRNKLLADLMDAQIRNPNGKDILDAFIHMVQNQKGYEDVHEHGLWISSNNGCRGWICSECGEFILVEEPRVLDRYLYPYCPGCGRSMSRGDN